MLLIKGAAMLLTQRRDDMSYFIEIDEYTLEATAKALAILNPGRASAGHMRTLAQSNMQDGSTSMSTGGWEAAGYFPKHREGVMVVRFAVSAYAVNKYLEYKAAVGSDPRVTIRQYETTVDGEGNWAVCEEGGGDVIADLMTEGVASRVCDFLNRHEILHELQQRLNRKERVT